jgi:uncharacterized protein (TIGR00251 family)
MPSFLQAHANGVYLSVKVQPRAPQNEIGEPLGNELRIKVTAPPVDSAANEALLGLVARALGCPRSAVQLVRGRTSRHKVVFVHGLTVAEAAKKLGAQ